MALRDVGLDDVRLLLAGFLVDIGRVDGTLAGDGATIDGDLQMDSVAFLEVQVALEDELNIEIDPIQVVELNEFGAIARYIHLLIHPR